jgi:hypothetical protein
LIDKVESRVLFVSETIWVIGGIVVVAVFVVQSVWLIAIPPLPLLR